MREQIIDTQEPNVLPSGTMLCGGKYKIIKKLGQGGFGITYLAESQIHGNLSNMKIQVAIKEFFMRDTNQRGYDNTSVTGSQTDIFIKYREKFKTEAKKLATIAQFDGIVKVYDDFEENNTAYYTMEYIEGCNLDDYIKQCGLLSESQAVDYIKSIASSVKQLHDNGMLHLDIKPKNVMRRTDGKLFLIDFGLAKQYDEYGNAESSKTIECGSPGYAPVEQNNYKGGFAPTLDIYALGSTFYRLLTGASAPESSDILNDGFGSLLQQMHRCGINEKSIAIVQKAMQPRKLDRYQTVDEFLAALRRNSLFQNENATIRNNQFVQANLSKDTENQYSNDATRKNVMHNATVDNNPPVRKKKWGCFAILGVVVALLLFVFIRFCYFKIRYSNDGYAILQDSTLTLYYGKNKPQRALPIYNPNFVDALNYVFGFKYNVGPGWRYCSEDIKKVVFDSSFKCCKPVDCSYWFFGCLNLVEITGMKEYLNTENVTNMEGMFLICVSLTSLDLSNFNTKNVANMCAMFSDCRNITSLDLSNFKTDNVTDMFCVFDHCINLKTIYVGYGWNTIKVQRSDGMFASCTNLVGGEGTECDGERDDASFARIDGGPSAPGYFTRKK